MRLFALLLLTFVSGLHAAAPRDFRDVQYVTGGSKAQRLDLSIPGDGAEKHPAMVWIHGGGWTGGSKNGNPAKPLLTRGYVVASVEYRFSQEAPFPAQIEDCKAAIRFLRAHAAEYAIDPDRIGVWGASAGGHLVALLGTTGQDKAFDKGENLQFSSAVQCVIDWFGPADFLHWGNINAEDASAGAANNPIAQLLGGPVKTKLDLAKAASPVYHVTKAAAPFLIIHGDADGLVPVQQSQVLDAALKKAGVESTLRVLPGANHGGPQFNAADVTRQMAEFVERHIGTK